MRLLIWSVIGAIAISALSPEPSEARRRGFRQGGGYRTGFVRRQRASYYKPASYTLAQIDRSGVSATQQRRSPQAATPQRRSIQGDDRFPMRPEPNIPREPQSNVTQARANSLRNYAGNQPHYAMRKLLGEPTRRTEDGAEIYNLKGTGSPYQASRRLVVRYTGNMATSWHQE